MLPRLLKMLRDVFSFSWVLQKICIKPERIYCFMALTEEHDNGFRSKALKRGARARNVKLLHDAGGVECIALNAHAFDVI